MIKIRYYADDYEQERHKKKVDLLNKIHERHGIAVEIVRVDPRHGPLLGFQGSIESIPEEEAWKRDFSRNRDLSRNIGEQPSRVFKTRSGHVA
ncbi:MAG: zinc ribbon domain-containing protein, partial [Candidatus Methanodesulfokora sp.]